MWTADQWRTSLAALGADPTGQMPTQKVWYEEPGIYHLDGNAIFFCPWCGSGLSTRDASEQMIAASNDMHIRVDRDSNVFVNDELVSGEGLQQAISRHAEKLTGEPDKS